MASMQSPLLRELVEKTTDWWHAYRIPVLLMTFVALVVLRIYLHRASSDEDGLLVFPKVYEEVKEKAKEVKETKTIKAIPKAATVKTAKTKTPRRINGKAKANGNGVNGNGVGVNGINRNNGTVAKTPSRIETLVFFSSMTGATAKLVQDYAAQLGEALKKVENVGSDVFATPQVLDLAEIDLDAYFISPPKSEDDDTHYFYLFLIPSYNIDSINDTVLEHLRETHNDFRIDTAPLTPLLGYAVFGFGDREGWPTDADGFCFQAREVDRWMAKLSGRKRAFPLGSCDTKNVAERRQRMDEWTTGVVDVLGLLARTGSLGEGVPGSGDAAESDEEGEEEEEEGAQEDINDMEDLGRMLGKKTLAVDFTTEGKMTKTTTTPKEMVAVDSPTYKSLTKQGYAIVGSHSGVKICRWTKSALRGRGSCYKYSFYGIHSHQCMETTPSLSCSNKCVFCWRHGTNPVGTTWRWKVDPPDLIFNGVKEQHYRKIKSLRGVPGVRSERFAEAMQIRHCALSLVGEPIFYPHINEFLQMLHREHISSFLVCNAQHPDQLAALQHVTQLYVSIDAADRDTLRKIDRPLHRDFWDRFQRCLSILREQRFRQRTVFRLTLVKGFNVDEAVQGYADLVEQALPCFIEVKGVTFCGTSTSAGVGLTMANVPFYREVCDFVEALAVELKVNRGLPYGLAAEHAHSCCVLLANERFRVDGKWHTTIDYDRFFQLLEQHGPDGDFRPEDYMGPATAEWATWGRGGFDPRDTRVDRKGRPIER